MAKTVSVTTIKQVQLKYFLTEEGRAQIKKEYEALRELKFNRMKNESPRTLVSEDVDGEYLTYYEDFNLMEMQLAKLESILNNAVIIQPPVKDGRNVVGLGATVTVKADNLKNKFEIIGSLEADPAAGKISAESPVGAALLGHKIGDIVAMKVPAKMVYRILDIKYEND